MGISHYIQTSKNWHSRPRTWCLRPGAYLAGLKAKAMASWTPTLLFPCLIGCMYCELLQRSVARWFRATSGACLRAACRSSTYCWSTPRSRFTTQQSFWTVTSPRLSHITASQSSPRSVTASRLLNQLFNKNTCSPDDRHDLRLSAITEQRTDSGVKYLASACISSHHEAIVMDTDWQTYRRHNRCQFHRLWVNVSTNNTVACSVLWRA